MFNQGTQLAKAVFGKVLFNIVCLSVLSLNNFKLQKNISHEKNFDTRKITTSVNSLALTGF